MKTVQALSVVEGSEAKLNIGQRHQSVKDLKCHAIGLFGSVIMVSTTASEARHARCARKNNVVASPMSNNV